MAGDSRMGLARLALAACAEAGAAPAIIDGTPSMGTTLPSGVWNDPLLSPADVGAAPCVGNPDGFDFDA